MWVWQLYNVASVNKQTVVSAVEYAGGKCPLRAYIAVCLQIHSNLTCLVVVGIDKAAVVISNETITAKYLYICIKRWYAVI